MENLTVALAICVVIIGVIWILARLSDETQAKINQLLLKQNEELRKSYNSAKEENYKLQFELMLIKLKECEKTDA